MSRVINPEGGGKERNRLSKAIVLALRELAGQSQPDLKTRDLIAFIILALRKISATIDSSVLAWEKRGYWVKADRFRLEWDWADSVAAELSRSLIQEDWGKVASVVPMIAQKLSHVKIATRNRIGTPWVDAWDAMQKIL